jgi:hypothetical protein
MTIPQLDTDLPNGKDNTFLVSIAENSQLFTATIVFRKNIYA